MMDCISGCLGGAAGVLVSHPFDTIKVRLQTQSHDNVKYRGTLHCAKTILQQESARGFYKGVFSPFSGAFVVNGIVFGVYGKISPKDIKDQTLRTESMAGAATGAIQSVIASPVELIKTRMQLNDSTPGVKRPNVWQVTKSIYLNEGGLRRGIFKAWGTTLCREVPGFSLYFGTHHYLANERHGPVGTLQQLMAGGMAGVVSWVFTFPIDVVKTRLQSDVSGKYSGAFDCCRKTLKAEGPQAFFRGLNSTILRAFPCNAACFYTISVIMSWYNQLKKDNGAAEKRQAIQEILGDAAQLSEKITESPIFTIPHYFGYISLSNSATNSMKNLKSSAADCLNVNDMNQRSQPMLNSTSNNGQAHNNLPSEKYLELNNYQNNDYTRTSNPNLSSMSSMQTELATASEDPSLANASTTNSIREKRLSHETSPLPLQEAVATSVHSTTTPGPSYYIHNSNDNLNTPLSRELPRYVVPTTASLDSKPEGAIKKKYNYEEEIYQRLQRLTEQFLGENAPSPSTRSLNLTDIAEWWVQHNMPAIPFCVCFNDEKCVCFD